jgi:hypothetical protein
LKHAGTSDQIILSVTVPGLQGRTEKGATRSGGVAPASSTGERSAGRETARFPLIRLAFSEK